MTPLRAGLCWALGMHRCFRHLSHLQRGAPSQGGAEAGEHVNCKDTERVCSE